MHKSCLALAVISFALTSANAARAADCEAAPIYFNGNVAELSGDVTVKAGKGCGFGLNGIQGAINETVIIQKPKFGTAGVRGHTAIYVAKPGYQGPDEFTYAHIGINQYGGPMKVSIRRKVTVVP
jgi:hypothetical protein